LIGIVFAPGIRYDAASAKSIEMSLITRGFIKITLPGNARQTKNRRGCLRFFVKGWIPTFAGMTTA